MRPEEEVLDWGKLHKNTTMENIPFDYLTWMIDNVDSSKEYNMSAYAKAEAEFIRRKNMKI